MNAYGYCRYSSDNQNEASIEQQKSELLEYANKNNINIVSFYCDEAKSATKDDRENFQNMIADCKKKLVDCILVWKTDRFARNTQDSLFYKMKLEKLGIKLISITQPIDSSTPEGNLMYTLLAGMDEYYSRNLASNVKRALKANANNCLSNGGTAPLGYDIIDRKYVINANEAPIVKLIYELYVDGKGLLDIASTLNDKGYTTKKKKKFGKNSIFEILSNEKYTGTYIYNKAVGNNRHAKRDDTIKVEDAFDAIISKEMFEKVQEIRKSHRNSGGQFRGENIYLLSGLIYCGECGARYCGSTSTKKKNGNVYKTGYYTCSNRNKLGKCHNHILKQKEIEEDVYKTLIQKILNGNSEEALLEKIRIEYTNLDSSKEELLKMYKISLAKNKQQIDNIVDMIADTGNRALIPKLEELQKEEDNLKQNIEYYSRVSKMNVSSEQIVNVLKKDLEVLQNNSKENIKNIIQKYIKRIIVYSDRYEIEYTFSKEISRSLTNRCYNSNRFTSTIYSSDFYYNSQFS